MTRLSGDDGQAIPPEWEPYWDRYERFIERGAVPRLDECLDGYVGDRTPVVACLLAVHQSACHAANRPWSDDYQKVCAANPKWAAVINQASVSRASNAAHRIARPSRGLPSPPFMHGSYCCVASLGPGGCGEVFLAIDERSGVKHSVKLPRLDDPELNTITTAALEQERAALLALPRHGGLLAYRDWEINSEQVPALVTEFEKATPLDRLRESNPRRIAAWMLQVSEAIGRAHDAGVQHCDLKPANVLVRDSDNRAVVIDFGLAQQMLRWSRSGPNTAPPNGSPAYLAPELARGDLDPDATLVDVFGLGALLYFLLTCRAPFAAETESQAIALAAEGKFHEGPLQKAHHPESLKRLCRDAMRSTPALRPASPEAFKLALDKTVVARQVRVIDVGNEWANWRTASAALTILLALVLLATSAHYLGQQAGKEGRLPVAGGWREAASNLGINPESIRADELAVSIQSRQREKGRWLKVGEEESDQGEIVVRVSPRLVDLADALEYRVGLRPWEPMYVRNREIYQRFGSLYARDLEVNGPISIRMGGVSTWGGGVLAGPFEYPIDISAALRRDASAYLDELVSQAQIDYPFDHRGSVWDLLTTYCNRYEDLIEVIRFGPHPNELNYKARPNEPYKQTFYTEIPITSVSLHISFLNNVSPIKDTPTLWVQFAFINGETSPVKRYDLPR